MARTPAPPPKPRRPKFRERRPSPEIPEIIIEDFSQKDKPMPYISPEDIDTIENIEIKLKSVGVNPQHITLWQYENIASKYSDFDAAFFEKIRLSENVAFYRLRKLKEPIKTQSKKDKPLRPLTYKEASIELRNKGISPNNISGFQYEQLEADDFDMNLISCETIASQGVSFKKYYLSRLKCAAETKSPNTVSYPPKPLKLPRCNNCKSCKIDNNCRSSEVKDDESCMFCGSKEFSYFYEWPEKEQKQWVWQAYLSGFSVEKTSETCGLSEPKCHLIRLEALHEHSDVVDIHHFFNIEEQKGIEIPPQIFSNYFLPLRDKFGNFIVYGSILVHYWDIGNKFVTSLVYPDQDQITAGSRGTNNDSYRWVKRLDKKSSKKYVVIGHITKNPELFRYFDHRVPKARPTQYEIDQTLAEYNEKHKVHRRFNS